MSKYTHGRVVENFPFSRIQVFCCIALRMWCKVEILLCLRLTPTYLVSIGVIEFRKHGILVFIQSLDLSLIQLVMSVSCLYCLTALTIDF